MENIEFDFKRKEYLLFLQLKEKNVNIGVIMLDKEKLVKTNELTKEKYLKNVIDLDYDRLERIEEKVNPRALVKIVQFIEKSYYFYCDTETRKNILEENLEKYNCNNKIIWKLEL